jgi:hypothetical protein
MEPLLNILALVGYFYLAYTNYSYPSIITNILLGISYTF